MLGEVEQTVKDTPPVDNGKSRFGNPAFKTFYDRIAEVRRLRLSCSLLSSQEAELEHLKTSRRLKSYTSRSLVYRRIVSTSFRRTSARAGGTELELIMAVGWSSTSSAGCEFQFGDVPSLLAHRPLPLAGSA